MNYVILTITDEGEQNWSGSGLTTTLEDYVYSCFEDSFDFTFLLNNVESFSSLIFFRKMLPNTGTNVVA